MKRFLTLTLALCTVLLMASCNANNLVEGIESEMQTVPSTEDYTSDTQETTDTDASTDSEPAESEPAESEPVIPRDPFIAGKAHNMIGASATAYTVGEDRYDISCDAYLLKNATVDDYNSLLAKLSETDLDKYTDNGASGIDNACFQTTLYNSQYTVNVTFYTAVKELYLTVEAFRALSPYQFAPTGTVKGKSTTFHMPEMPTVNGSYKFGECEIFQLSTGHFVIVDGAQEFSAEPTVNYLLSLTGGETPIVDAWFLTHAHPDHSYCVWGIGRDATLVSKIRVEGFYYTWPNDNGMRKESDYEGLLEQVANVNGAMENFRDSQGNVTAKYKLHGGMRFYFNELEVQVLFTQDQIMPNEYGNGFNDTSTSYKFTVHTEGKDDTTFLMMGDASSALCKKLMKMYTADTLHTNYFQSLHHGSNDCLEFFQYIRPDYLNYTYKNEKGKDKAGYKYLHNTCKAVYCQPLVIKMTAAD